MKFKPRGSRRAKARQRAQRRFYIVIGRAIVEQFERNPPRFDRPYDVPFQATGYYDGVKFVKVYG